MDTALSFSAPPHTLTGADVLATLESDGAGLTSDAVAARLATHGPNVLPEAPPRTIGAMLVDQFRDFLILLLVGAAVGLGSRRRCRRHGRDRRHRAAERGGRCRAGVSRPAGDGGAAADGGRHARSSGGTGPPSRFPRIELAPGDVVLLDAGRIVPADLRLLETAQLRIAEAALTGESRPGREASRRQPAARTRRSVTASTMAYRGTHDRARARRGRRRRDGGCDTELGKIASLLDGHGRREDAPAEAARALRAGPRLRRDCPRAPRLRRSGCCAARTRSSCSSRP